VIRLLPKHAPHPLPIHLIYPASRRHSAKLAAFAYHLKEQMAR
jgi:DNA-binding transcriptional LysR family regulator